MPDNSSINVQVMPKANGETTMIGQSYRNLAESITDLDHAISDLIAKIGPVLAPEFDTRGEDPNNDKPVKSELALVIDNERVRIQDMTNAVRSVFNRIEL